MRKGTEREGKGIPPPQRQVEYNKHWPTAPIRADALIGCTVTGAHLLSFLVEGDVLVAEFDARRHDRL